jgi:hypothetical protein
VRSPLLSFAAVCVVLSACAAPAASPPFTSPGTSPVDLTGSRDALGRTSEGAPAPVGAFGGGNRAALPAPTRAPEATRGAPQTTRAAQAGNVPVQQTENTGALLGRMVIQVASLVLTVDNLENRLTQVYQLTASTRGYLSELNVNAAERGPRATFVLKVPPDQLDSTLVALRQMALVVRDQKLGSEDVTAEFSDLEQIVANLESSEQQYREIMKRMTQPEDIVKIFNELTRIRGEIEVLKGRMNHQCRDAAGDSGHADSYADAAAHRHPDAALERGRRVRRRQHRAGTPQRIGDDAADLVCSGHLALRAGRAVAAGDAVAAAAHGRAAHHRAQAVT